MEWLLIATVAIPAVAAAIALVMFYGWLFRNIAAWFVIEIGNFRRRAK